MKIKNRKGFTLIELLAVITILGILMLVAIPSVQRVIENARKDTMIDNAKKYADAVNTQWAADNIQCRTSATDTTMDTLGSSVPGGKKYFIPFETGTSYPVPSGSSGNTTLFPWSDSGKPNQNVTRTTARSNATYLIDKGGKSGWGNADVVGVVVVSKAASGNNTYSVAMIDGAGHGLSTTTISYDVDKLKRGNALSSGAVVKYTESALGWECQVMS